MRKWRVGSISTGILFITLGVLLLGRQLWNIPLDLILINWWPIILILLGVEVLAYHVIRKDSPLKFDLFSMFVLFIALIFTLGLYTVQSSGILPAVRHAVNADRHTIDIQKTMDIPDSVKEVVIDIPNGEIEIIGSKEKEMNVNGTIRLDASNQEEAQDEIAKRFTVKTVGSQAIIRLEEGNPAKWFGNQGINVQLAITIPEGLELQSKLVNGDTKVIGMKNQSNIKGVNGKVEIQQNQGNINAKVTNGDIVIDEVNANLQLNTTNGEIKVKTSQVAGDWDIGTTNGKITITLPAKANAKIEAKSSVGSVEGDINWIKKDEDKVVGSEKEATLGNGQHLIKLKGQNGEIEVNVK